MKYARLQSQTQISKINKYTKFDETSLKVTQVIIHKRKCGQTDVRQMDGHTDVQRETTLPRHHCVWKMIRKQYANVSYIPSVYSYRGSSMRMVAICGPIADA